MAHASAADVRRLLAHRSDGAMRLLSELVAASSPLGTSGLEAQLVVARYLQEAGYVVSYTTDTPWQHACHEEYTPPLPGENPVNLIAAPPDRAGTRLALLAHIDTEAAGDGWTTPPTRCTVRDGRAYALGAADDKGGVAAAVVAAATLLELGERAPLVMSVHGKGGGARGTLPMFARSHPIDAVLYVHPAETGRGLAEVKHASRGVLDIALQISGWQGPLAEIGTPESAKYADGGDALQAALRGIDQLRRSALAGCTVNIGVLTAGTRVGLVPSQCDLQMRVLFGGRTSSATLFATIEAELEQYMLDLSATGGRFTVRAGLLFSANPAITDWESPLCRAVRRAIEHETGRAPAAYPGHMASDLRFPIRMHGIPAVGVGCVAGGFYGPDEWVDVDDLLRLVAVIVATAQAWNREEKS